MARYGFSIEKSLDFREARQGVSNVYFYEGAPALDGVLNDIIDEIVLNERALHSTLVRFDRARAWTAGGTPGENVMRVVRDLTGTGERGLNTSLDPERAILAQWPAGTNILGRPVYLRKWYHINGNPSAGAFTTSVLNQSDPIDPAIRASLAAGIENLRVVGPGAIDEYALVSETGRTTSGAVQVYPWLEHRDLGNEWRSR